MRCASLEETHRMAARLAEGLRPGDVLALVGELGAGKTAFVQGLATGLDVVNRREVRSPTFTVIHEYQGRTPLYHIDLYRIERLADVDALGLEEYFDGSGVTAVEWADKFPEIFPERTKWLRFEIVDATAREIEITYGTL